MNGSGGSNDGSLRSIHKRKRERLDGGGVVCRLETVHLQLLRLGQSRLGQPLANVLTLVTLQLQHLTVFRVFHNGTVARKFLDKRGVLMCVRLCYPPSHSPFYMPGRSSSGHTRRRGPGPWLVSSGHSSVGSLYAQVRLVHSHQHP